MKRGRDRETTTHEKYSIIEDDFSTTTSQMDVKLHSLVFTAK